MSLHSTNTDSVGLVPCVGSKPRPRHKDSGRGGLPLRHILMYVTRCNTCQSLVPEECSRLAKSPPFPFYRSLRPHDHSVSNVLRNEGLKRHVVRSQRPIPLRVEFPSSLVLGLLRVLLQRKPALVVSATVVRETRIGVEVSEETWCLDFFEHLLFDLVAIFALRYCAGETPVFPVQL
jgi:hypothetical protein